jgi:signal transduction histidine kinase
MQSGQPLINVERPTIDATGQPKTVLTTKIPLRDREGKLIGLIGISRDITERKELEKQTVDLATQRERVQLLEHFIRDMSHDFRTPLAIINSSLYLFKKNMLDCLLRWKNMLLRENYIVAYSLYKSFTRDFDIYDISRNLFLLCMHIGIPTHRSDAYEWSSLKRMTDDCT